MQCPQCKNEVPVNESHYGALFTCPQCRAVYFINFEGQPEYGDMDLPPENLNIPAELSTDSLTDFPDFSADFKTDFSTDSASDNPETLNVEIESHLNSFVQTAQEISDYGNNEETVSNINYNLFIKGLDSKEVMQEFKQAIEDSKFGWIASDILINIKNGEIIIEKLNPIQAYVLAERIQFLNIEIEWKQNVAF